MMFFWLTKIPKTLEKGLGVNWNWVRSVWETSALSSINSNGPDVMRRGIVELAHTVLGPCEGNSLTSLILSCGVAAAKKRKMKSSLNIKNKDFWAPRHRLRTLSQVSLKRKKKRCYMFQACTSCVNELPNTFCGSSAADAPPWDENSSIKYTQEVETVGK